MTKKKHNFRVGDEVKVVGPHMYNGREYITECTVGSIGVIRNVYDNERPHVELKWSSHPRSFKREAGSGSNIDVTGLTLTGPAEEELDAEAARLFGLQTSLTQQFEAGHGRPDLDRLYEVFYELERGENPAVIRENLVQYLNHRPDDRKKP